MCIFHQYHYVPDLKTWTEAQSYCTQTYTNLATVESTEEMNQLINTVSSAGYNSEVWIGVYFYISWIWTYDITADYWKWENQTENEPFLIYYVCEGISNYGGQPENCSVKHPFACDNGEHTHQPSPAV